MFNFEKIAEDLGKVNEGIETLKDLKKDAKSMASELKLFNKNVKKMMPLFEKLVPILERSEPKFEALVGIMEKLDGNFDNVLQLLEIVGVPTKKAEKAASAVEGH